MPDLYRVRISDAALQNLQAIFDYIHKSSPQNAATVIERILDAIDGLETMPGKYRVAGRSRKRGSEVHACVVRPFIIYFRVDEDVRAATVLEIRHGARKQPRHFE